MEPAEPVLAEIEQCLQSEWWNYPLETLEWLAHLVERSGRTVWWKQIL